MTGCLDITGFYDHFASASILGERDDVGSRVAPWNETRRRFKCKISITESRYSMGFKRRRPLIRDYARADINRN